MLPDKNDDIKIVNTTTEDDDVVSLLLKKSYRIAEKKWL